MFKIQGCDFYNGSRKVGELRGELFDSHGSKIGSFKGKNIFDKNGHVVGTVRGDGVYQEGTRITTLTDIRKKIQGQGDMSIAALWLLLVK
jgi:cell shape-determining protein MreC